MPRWRRDGKELFYVSDAAMLAVEVKTGAGHFEAGIPKELFPLPAIAPRSTFTVTDDGQKFLMITQAVETGSDPITNAELAVGREALKGTSLALRQHTLRRAVVERSQDRYTTIKGKSHGCGAQ